MANQTIAKVNAMPAPTWSWLKMNDVDVHLSEGLKTVVHKVDADASLLGASDTFDAALAEMSKRYGRVGDKQSDERAMSVAALEGDQGTDNLDVPALSSYERAALRSELQGDAAADFCTGTSEEMRSYILGVAGKTTVINAQRGVSGEAFVSVAAQEGVQSAVAIDVVLEPHASLELALSLDAPSDGPSFIGSSLRVCAAEQSHLDLTVYLTAGSQATAIEDSGFVLGEGARARVRHVVLSGGFTATGLAADLRGDTSHLSIDTSYLASGSEQRDFNYIIRHHGCKTTSDMNANGVLAGTSKKCLRGTIELIHGAKGAEGNERETVLLASKGVDNKTVPTILCDEDDVAGNHGATIGHVRPEQLFYAACRGLSQDQTEALFLSAKLEDALLNAPNEVCVQQVKRLGTKLIPHFEEEIAC